VLRDEDFGEEAAGMQRDIAVWAPTWALLRDEADEESAEESGPKAAPSRQR